MTEDTVIELAKQAGFLPDVGIPVHPSNLFKFAALVAAAEREECAKVCDTMQKVGHEFWAPEDAEVEQGVRAGAAMCAAAIRIRT